MGAFGDTDSVDRFWDTSTSVDENKAYRTGKERLAAGDAAGAVEAWTQAAEQGVDVAWELMELCYQMGRFQDANHWGSAYQRRHQENHKAAEFLNQRRKEAYDQAFAAYNDRELETAFRLFTQSMDLGYPAAFYSVGYMLERGEGTARDVRKALDNYEILAAVGHKGAQRCLRRWEAAEKAARVLNNIELVEQLYLGIENPYSGLIRDVTAYARACYMRADYEKALPLLSYLSAIGSWTGDMLLGRMYSKGQGVPVDRDRAIELYNHMVPPGEGKVGFIMFGGYPSDANGAPREMLWAVLDRRGNELLLMSVSAIETRPYHNEYTASWETSDLRRWLNEDFLRDAFTAEERSMIRSSWVINSDDVEQHLRKGNDTQDRVFLMSLQEAETYFMRDTFQRLDETVDWRSTLQGVQYRADYDIIRAPLTDYIVAQGARISNQNAMWWLRSEGMNSGYAALVRDKDIIDAGGMPVTTTGIGVRPVMWIRLDME